VRNNFCKPLCKLNEKPRPSVPHAQEHLQKPLSRLFRTLNSEVKVTSKHWKNDPIRVVVGRFLGNLYRLHEPLLCPQLPNPIQRGDTVARRQRRILEFGKLSHSRYHITLLGRRGND
jgi:hypothetical protein